MLNVPAYAAYLSASEVWQYVSPSAAALLGASAGTLRGKSLEGSLPTGTLADLRTWLLKARERRGAVEYQLTSTHGGNSVQLRISPEFAATGALCGYHMLGFQTGARRPAELENTDRQESVPSILWAKQRSQRTRADDGTGLVLPTSRWHAFTFTLNPQGHILDVNQSTLELLEANRKSLIRKPFWQLSIFPSAERGRIRQALAQASQDVLEQFPVACELPCGRIRRLELTIRPIHHPEDQLSILVVEGMARPEFYDDRYAAREVEDNFIHLIANCQDAVIFVNAQQRITLFNRSAERMFGVSASEANGQPMSLLMPEPYAAEHHDYIARYLNAGPARALGRVIEARGQRHDGEVFPIELVVTELHLNAHARFAAFIRDVTVQRAMQHELDHQRHLSTMGLTASIFAHEVGNPLNNMAMQAEVLTRCLRHTPGPALTASQQILSEIKRLSRLLTEFRELGQPSPTHLQKVDLKALLLDVVRGQHVSNQQPDVQIRLDVPDGLPAVAAHPDKLRQMMLNLCKNALEAMGDRGRLTIGAQATVDGVQIEVADTGPGVAEGIDIFEPFCTTKPDGTGLGLSVSQRIAQDHGGELTYRSKPGEGTVFSVRLPLGKAHGSLRDIVANGQR